MNARDKIAFAIAESEYLNPPEDDFEPKRCACCEAVPDDDKLYKFDGEWYCLECLTYEMLECRNACDKREW